MIITATGFLILLIASFVFWLWVLVDCLVNQQEDRIIWVIVILFLNLLGAILYFFIARSKRLSEVITFRSKDENLNE